MQTLLSSYHEHTAISTMILIKREQVHTINWWDTQPGTQNKEEEEQEKVCWSQETWKRGGWLSPLCSS